MARLGASLKRSHVRSDGMEHVGPHQPECRLIHDCFVNDAPLHCMRLEESRLEQRAELSEGGLVACLGDRALQTIHLLGAGRRGGRGCSAAITDAKTASADTADAARRGHMAIACDDQSLALKHTASREVIQGDRGGHRFD